MSGIIKEHLKAGKRFLVLELSKEKGKAMLCAASEVADHLDGSHVAVVDLEEILRRFQKEAPPRDVFTLTEVATMASEKSPTVHSWVKAGLLTPSERNRDGTRGRAMLFDRTDAFLACLIASLKRRCGLQLSKLRGVSDVLRPPKARRRRKAVVSNAKGATR